jgi:lambda family phage minor tail protein L
MSNETALVTELLKFSPDTLLEFFVLDLTPIVEYYSSKSITISPTKYYFYNGINQRKDGGATSIVWQGNTYARIPIEMDFVNITSGGELPKPAIKIADNTNPRLLLPLLLAYDDLVGCSIVRKRTFLKFIDAANFNGGVSPYTPDSTACFPDEVFRIERKSSETKLSVEFELAVAWDMEGVLLPRRLVLANLCPWEYRKGVSTSFGISSTNAADLNTSDSWAEISNINSSINARFLSIAHNGTGTLLAVGSSGAILRSTDYGVTWSSITSFSVDTFNSVTFGLSNFIIVGTRGRVFTSPTGASGTWTFQTSGTTNTLRGISTSATIATAVGENRTILYSSNLSTWTAVTLTGGQTYDLTDVVFNTTNNRFIACGTAGTVLYSATGVATSWTKVSVTNVTLNKMAINGARTLVVGSSGVIFASDNATSWTSSGTVRATNLTGITYTTANLFLVIDSSNNVWKSINSDGTASNGAAWDDVRSNIDISSKSIIYVANGTRTIILGAKRTELAISGCTYDGSRYFTQNDVITTDRTQDVCGKRLVSCKLRFGQQNVILPFGGFPSSGFVQ